MSELNLKTIDTVDTSPFKKLVMTIGELPTSFVESMTYYEALAWLVNYLENTIIPTINNNAEVSQELQELFTTLYNFVHDYFDNLDVQEEINNKLDAMAEDGTLQEIITTYIQSNVAWTFDTVADMKSATNLIDGSYAQTLGFYSIDDGGAGLYHITDTGTANEMDVIAVGDLYANLISGKEIRPEQMGAYGDGTHDDTTAIQACIDSGKTVVFSKKTYLAFLVYANVDNTVLEGNGCTLKRPDLSGEPWNYNASQMAYINTIRITESCTVNNIIFDNDCFSMWQVSDGYTQEHSSSFLIGNNDKKIYVNINDCICKNSAGDGIQIVNNAVAKINNYTSIDTFRGGVTIVGNSEVEVNNWSSNVVTTGMHDGVDIEVDSAGSSTIANTLKVTLNNVVMDYDLDIGCPANGHVVVNNLVQRAFDQETLPGFHLSANGGYIQINNSILRGGTHPRSSHVSIVRDGKIKLSNTKIIGNTSVALIELTQYTSEGNNDCYLCIENCDIDCYKFLRTGQFRGQIMIKNNNIRCTNNFSEGISVNTQVAKGLFLIDNYIEFAGRFMSVTKSTTSAGDPSVYLYGNTVKGSGDNDMLIGGTVNIYFDSTPMEGAYKVSLGVGATPNYWGINRVIIVPTSTDLNFRGFVPGEDIAICKDTGAKYRYTSGVTWTAIE